MERALQRSDRSDNDTEGLCKDIPSCVVSATVVIGGAIYYVIKNTLMRVVQRALDVFNIKRRLKL